MKRSPLRRFTPLRGHSTLSRKRRSPLRSVRFAADSVADAVVRRSHGTCELCRAAAATQMHHRRMRSAGGADISENISHTCRSCHHDVIHAHPDWSYRHGLLLRRSSVGHPDPVYGCGLDCTVDHYD